MKKPSKDDGWADKLAYRYLKAVDTLWMNVGRIRNGARKRRRKRPNARRKGPAGPKELKKEQVNGGSLEDQA